MKFQVAEVQFERFHDLTERVVGGRPEGVASLIQNGAQVPECLPGVRKVYTAATLAYNTFFVELVKRIPAVADALASTDRFEGHTEAIKAVCNGVIFDDVFSEDFFRNVSNPQEIREVFS